MKKSRIAAIAAAALASGLVLTACSSSSDDGNAAEPAASEAAAVADDAEMEDDAEMASEPAEAPGTIVDIAAGAADFSTLVAAAQAAGLVDTLNGEGPFTVFAPTDAAFAALPEGLVDALLLPENKDTLAKILTYHVVPGTVMAADIADGDVATVEGQDITLSTADGVTVNGVKVIQADIVASNGVVHVIEGVIVPPDVDAAALLAE